MSDNLPPIIPSGSEPENNSNLPPIVPPVVSNTYSGQPSASGPLYQPVKTSPIGIVVLIVSMCLVVGLCGFNAFYSVATNVHVGDHELSRKELKAARKEVLEMFKNAKDGDPNSVDTNVITTNGLSESCQKLFRTMISTTNEAESAMNKIDVDVLTGYKLATKGGLETSRKNSILVDNTLIKTYDAQWFAIKEFQGVWRNAYKLESNF